MHLLPADELDSVRAHLEGSGYAVTTAVTPAEAGLRETQAELARALRLPGTAASNLDAMADALRDLPQIWQGQDVALIWQDAGRLAAADGRAWWILAEILDDADDLTVVALGESQLGRRRDAPAAGAPPGAREGGGTGGGVGGVPGGETGGTDGHGRPGTNGLPRQPGGAGR